MDDEAFDKTIDDGLLIKTLGDSDALMSFQRQSSTAVEWSLQFGDGPADSANRTADSLTIKRGGQKDGAPLLTLQAPPDGSDAALNLRGRFSIAGDAGNAADAVRMDVSGAVRANGRIGREWTAAADGQFHPISDSLKGCVAFEIVAGVGSPEEGRFALVYAIAMNTFNPMRWDNLFGLKKRIRQQHAYYGRHNDRLELRWIPNRDKPTVEQYGQNAQYHLNIRTRSNYNNKNSKIVAHVTQLWFDPVMSWAKKPA
ncbi:MAG: hypothetical protein WA840_09565 [Caulobacteraceae bacterium]